MSRARGGFGLHQGGGQFDGDLALRQGQPVDLAERVGGQVARARDVSGTLVAAAQRHRQRQVGQALGVGGRLTAESLERLQRRTDPALGLQCACTAEPRVRGQHHVLLAGDLDDLTETIRRDGRVAVEELQLRVAQTKLGVDALAWLDPMQQELGGAPQSLGQQTGDHGVGVRLPDSMRET